MKSMKRILATVLILLMVNLYLPRIAGAEQQDSPANAAITKHPPQILSTPEQEIPTVEEKKSKWTWVILVVLIAGVAAAAGGGGGDGAAAPAGGGGAPAPAPTTGDVTVGW